MLGDNQFLLTLPNLSLNMGKCKVERLFRPARHVPHGQWVVFNSLHLSQVLNTFGCVALGVLRYKQ